MKKPKPSGEKKPEPKKPARRFVVTTKYDGDEWVVGARAIKPLAEAKKLAKQCGNPTIYELVPVAGGRTNAKR